MENPTFDQNVEKGELELKSVKMMESNNHNSPDKTESSNQSNVCQPDICREMHERYLEQKSKMAASPWHRLKTIFLLGIIVLLVLWLIAYSVCSRLNLI